jgi:1-aminocyclopropane-1-carboxylate deaminase/D-cysteine desulfhydrase-like pyridoxal-dependent ACC family enzyme
LSLPLFDRFPRLHGRIPHLQLGHFPTAVEAHTLDAGGGPRQFLVKRDDLCGDPYGGNKVRKLEFLLARARAQGARRLLTAGATGSHHALATTVYGRQHGFEVTLVLFPQTRNAHVRDILLMDHALGAELRFTLRMESVPFALLRARLAHARERPFVIAPGGSDPVGTIGYVNAGLEFAAQLADGTAQRPRAIYLAAGTLGTAVGLAIGLSSAGIEIPIVAVRITPRFVTNEAVMKRLLTRTHALLERAGADLPPPAAALRLLEMHHEQFGEGYGRATQAGTAAGEQLATLGLGVDPTYTAKAAAALLAALHAGTEPDAPGDSGQPPLFWHTLSAREPRHLLRPDTADTLPAPFAEYLRR